MVSECESTNELSEIDFGLNERIQNLENSIGDISTLYLPIVEEDALNHFNVPLHRHPLTYVI